MRWRLCACVLRPGLSSAPVLMAFSGFGIGVLRMEYSVLNPIVILLGISGKEARPDAQKMTSGSATETPPIHWLT
jgi:hypothetical protein